MPGQRLLCLFNQRIHFGSTRLDLIRFDSNYEFTARMGMGQYNVIHRGYTIYRMAYVMPIIQFKIVYLKQLLLEFILLNPLFNPVISLLDIQAQTCNHSLSSKSVKSPCVPAMSRVKLLLLLLLLFGLPIAGCNSLSWGSGIGDQGSWNRVAAIHMCPHTSMPDTHALCSAPLTCR